MFSYIDSTIREDLENRHLLVTLSNDSHVVSSTDENAAMSVLGPVPIPRTINKQNITLEWYPFVRKTELGHVLEAAHQVKDGNSENFRNLLQTHMSVNSIFALPGFREAKNPLVRLHSCCLTGDIFGSQRCDCGPQLEAAFEKILEHGSGAVVYMSGHEGRGIGLWAKAITYLLQDSGQDTFAANTALGLPEDSRDFGDAAIVLRYLLNNKPIHLLSNNPVKREQLEAHQQKVTEIVPLVTGICEHNLKYIRSKREKGHLLPKDL